LNVHGWGDFSNVISIKAATVPLQITSISTTVDSLTGDVKVQWTAPDPQGDPITSYLIEIADSTSVNSWHQDTVNCPGIDPSLIYCFIPMKTLQQAPFSYSIDDLIQVRVSAVNA
jgi:hypothetical protein